MTNRLALFPMAVALLASPLADAKSELEVLRARCAEQERQIRELEDENGKLRDLQGMAPKYASRPAPAAATGADSAAAPGKRATSGSPAAAQAGETATYTVRRGESWESVARKHGTRPDKLASHNGTTHDAVLREGQKLKVPATAEAAGQPAAAAATATATAETGTYKVQDNDTFYGIGKRLGISAEALAEANPTVKPTALRPGLILRLPPAPAKSPGPKSTAATAPEPTHTAKATAASADAAPPMVAKAQAARVQAPAAPAPARSQPVIKSITVYDSPTYGEFAAKHGTTVGRLNDLNALNLVENAVLAKGSELLVPAQP